MPDTPHWRRFVVSAVLSLFCAGSFVAGCGGRSSGTTTLTVLAASSTQEVLKELGMAYQREHREVRPVFYFGGSQEMAARLSEHDPGDVLVTANEATMNSADEYLTGRRRIIAHNSLTIAVGPGNPRRIRGLHDLTRPRLRIAIGAASVPVGAYARQVFANAGLTVRWTSEEISARTVLDEVRMGEADAGLVYITDLRAAGAAVSSVPIPAHDNVTATYVAAAVKESAHEEAAASFVAWLSSPVARSLINKHGFVTPRQ